MNTVKDSALFIQLCMVIQQLPQLLPAKLYILQNGTEKFYKWIFINMSVSYKHPSADFIPETTKFCAQHFPKSVSRSSDRGKMRKRSICMSRETTVLVKKTKLEFRATVGNLEATVTIKARENATSLNVLSK